MPLHRILILEDEPFIALDLQLTCEDMGLEAVTAATSEAALAAIATQPFDGAILDVNLGRGETCLNVANALRARGVPFVLNTGDLDRAGEFVRGMDAPIISKPSASQDVIRRLSDLAEVQTA